MEIDRGERREDVSDEKGCSSDPESTVETGTCTALLVTVRGS